MTTTCGEHLIRLLEAYGVDTVFGIPGVHTVELYRGLETSSIRHIAPRHEQGAGFMADGYARSTGKVGVCFCITGPGMTNIATAMGQAYADSIPMLVISGVNQRATLGLGHGQLHEMKNQREMLSGVTTLSHTLLSPEDLPEVIARAFTVLHSERPRPVHIEIPIDLIGKPITDSTVKIARPASRPGPDPRKIAEIADVIAGAERGLVLVGGGCVDAVAELAEFVDLTGSPTCLTINARGLLPPDHPLLLDGFQFSDKFRDYVTQTDVCIAIGTELGETDYDFYGKGPLKPGGAMIRIDIDPRQLFANASPTHSVVSDAGLALQALNDALKSRTDLRAQSDGARIVHTINTSVLAEFPPETDQYRELMAAILQAQPDAIIVGDSTKPIYHANFIHRAPAPRHWFNSVTGFGTLGYAMPAATGAGIGNPDVPVVAISGDGGFQFTLNELMTAQQERVPIAVIIWNNASYREIRDYMIARDIAPIGVDINGPDLSALSAAMGVAYVKADSIADIGVALRSMKDRTGPMIVEHVATIDA